MKQNLAKRWLFYVVGLIILALGIALTIKGRLLGLGSWDVLHYGLWQTFGLTIGSVGDHYRCLDRPVDCHWHETLA